MTLLVFLGPPGSGKGTLAQFLVSAKNFLQVSTGDLIRDEISKNTKLGKKMKEIIATGNLVSDDIILSIMKPFLEKEGNIILDGFPRTLKQAEMLDSFLSQKSKKIDAVIYVNLPEKDLIKRITGRRICPKCKRIYNIYFPDLAPKNDTLCDYDNTPLIHRDDDKEEVVRQRLKQYHEKTKPLIEYYRKKGILKELKATNNLEENQKKLLNLLF